MADLYRLKQARKLRFAELQAKITTERKQLESMGRRKTSNDRGQVYKQRGWISWRRRAHNTSDFSRAHNTSDFSRAHNTSDFSRAHNTSDFSRAHDTSDFTRTGGPQCLWQYDFGVWNGFDPREVNRPEYAYYLSKKTRPLLDGHRFLHAVDLTNMTSGGMKTGCWRKVKSMPDCGCQVLLQWDPLHDERDSSSSDKEPEDEEPLPLEDFRFLTLNPVSRRDARHVHCNHHPLQLIGSSIRGSYRTRSDFWSRYREPVEKGALVPIRVKGKMDIQLKPAGSVEIASERVSSKNMNKTQKDTYDYLPLRNWLKQCGLLKECYNKLKGEKITMTELKQLTEEQMRSVGIPLGSCKRLMSAIQKERESPAALPNEFLCPITTAVMKDPVVAADGFTYEREAILKWFEEHNRSPLTNEDLTSKDVMPNRQLKKLIEDHRSKGNEM